jgi:parallel beta-helix repeat protein
MISIALALMILVLAFPSRGSAQTARVTSLLDQGQGTLRTAIEQSNGLGGGSIAFDVAGTIELRSALPTLTSGGITIDGCTALGVVVLVRAPDVSDRFDGLRVESSGNTVRCLTVRNFLRDGISVVGAEARGNRVELNTIEGAGDDGIGVALGADATVSSNVVIGSVNKGILVWHGSTGKLLGNTVSYNKDGISITSASTAMIEANTTENNADNGIAVISGSAATVSGNLIQANRGIGIWLRDSETSAVITGNTIDHNSNHGVGVKSGVTAHVDGNVISNNAGAGIWMESSADVLLGSNTFVNNAKGNVKVVP